MARAVRHKRRPEWFGTEVRPAWGVLVKAEVMEGAEGTHEIPALHNGLDWCDENGAPLSPKLKVLRWRHRDWKIDGAAAESKGWAL